MNQLKLPIIPHLSMNMTSLLPTENKFSKKTLRKTSLMTDHLFHPHPAMQTSSPNCLAEILTQTAHCQPPPEMHEKKKRKQKNFIPCCNELLYGETHYICRCNESFTKCLCSKWYPTTDILHTKKCTKPSCLSFFKACPCERLVMIPPTQTFQCDCGKLHK